MGEVIKMTTEDGVEVAVSHNRRGLISENRSALRRPGEAIR